MARDPALLKAYPAPCREDTRSTQIREEVAFSPRACRARPNQHILSRWTWLFSREPKVDVATCGSQFIQIMAVGHSFKWLGWAVEVCAEGVEEMHRALEELRRAGVRIPQIPQPGLRLLPVRDGGFENVMSASNLMAKSIQTCIRSHSNTKGRACARASRMLCDEAFCVWTQLWLFPNHLLASTSP